MRFKKTLLATHVALAVALFAQGQAALAGCSTTGTETTCDATIWDPPATGTTNLVINTGTTEGKLAPMQGFGIYGNSSGTRFNLSDATTTITTGGNKADAIQVNNGVNHMRPLAS
ncbi:MAG: hypothetical protein QM805_16290 [Pseudomonas sp.]